jgi:large subunit ribosomal protein L17
MRHRVAGRKLGRTTEHRRALLRNLSTALFDKERITTTLVKAKELRPFAEKLVTMAKRETLHARRQVLRQIHDRTVVAKLFDTLSARYAERPGGYTRIIKLGPRRGDNAEMALIELVGAEDAAAEAPAEETKAKGKTKAKAKAEPEAAEASAKTTKKKTAKKTAKKKTAKKKAAAKGDD